MRSRRVMKISSLFTAMTLLVSVIVSSPIFSFAETAEEYQTMLDKLKTELTAKLPKSPDEKQADKLLASDALDDKLVKFAVIKEATPEGLAEFAGKSERNKALIDKLLAAPSFMKQMLVADGARGGKYGRAMEIYADIQKASSKSREGVLQRLALAIALEHAEPHAQRSAKARTDAPEHVDPVKRYLSYEKAYLDGELDVAFSTLDTFNLRFVVDGEEPDEIAAWGREMLKNFRPDHVLNENYGWRYVSIVPSDVRYGSGDVKFDRDELQFFQNILMNGGVCGRRAFFGRFILRAFGIPTTARPSRGHAALAHWTPKGWVVNLGPRWGGGWTKTIYDKDKDFLATTQARVSPEEYLKVKRAQWIGDVLGEKPVYGKSVKEKPAFWYALSLSTQDSIIEGLKSETLEALGAELGESNDTVAENLVAAEVKPEDKQITYNKDGSIVIPAAAHSRPEGNAKDAPAMKSFAGGLQVFMPRFSRKGVTIMRGGAWRGGADSCRSGWRMPSSGYGRYNNWGFRVAATPKGGKIKDELSLDLGDGLTLELVYIKPGTFIMGGEDDKDSKWHGRETPKHEVTLTKGYYMGKYEVTQAQIKAMTGRNPSKASKDPNCPADNVSEGDAVEFCIKVAEKTGMDVRLPTEAEWEYACRAGTQTKYFFGDDASKLDDYAWYDKNDGGKSHPVGQKKPNPWGLYDILGNVCERVSDTYSKDYYAKSPKVDPTGPKEGTKSNLGYDITVAKAGDYLLTARVVTANYDQTIFVSANDGSESTLILPFTKGSWQDSKPVKIALKEGANTLNVLRRDPPQYGVAVKSFTLKPM